MIRIIVFGLALVAMISVPAHAQFVFPPNWWAMTSAPTSCAPYRTFATAPYQIFAAPPYRTGC